MEEKTYKFNFIEDNFEITDKTLVVIDTNYLLYTLQSYYFGSKYTEALQKNIDNLYIPYIVFMEFYTQKDENEIKSVKIENIAMEFLKYKKTIQG